MRVLHVTPYFAPAFRYGGPPRTVLGLCHALVACGIDVEVVTTTANGDAPLPASPAGGTVYEGIPVHYAAQTFPRRFFGAALDAPLRSALARSDLCHIHGIWNVPEWLAARRAQASQTPYVVSTRGMLQPAALARHRWRKRVMYHLVERRNLAHAARVHTTAPDETAVVSRLIDRRKIVEIPNGVDLDAPARARAGARARLGIPPADPVVVFLGRLHPIKRVDLLAAAVVRVRATHPTTHLVLAGPDEGDHLARLQGDLAPLGAFAHVMGSVSDEEKSALLADATVLALCSDSESFGMAVVEAMAAALPVVVARTCGWSDIERDGCGVLVDQRVEGIAAGIARVLAEPGRAAAMGRRGAQIARERYGWRAVGERMAACYENVLSNGRPADRCAGA